MGSSLVRWSVLALCLSAPPIFASPASAADRPVERVVAKSPGIFMRVFGPTAPPIGYVKFCERLPGECVGGTADEVRFELTPQRLNELDRVNRLVNREIAPATDMELYGVEEYWTYPDHRKKGDCEDYVLLKRRILIDQGWPAGALLVTVVRDDRREGHAILTVRTAQGDFVVDNKNDEIKPWHRSSYEFVMRQSYLNPRAWMSLEQTPPSSNVPVAGVRSRR